MSDLGMQHQHYPDTSRRPAVNTVEMSAQRPGRAGQRARLALELESRKKSGTRATHDDYQPWWWGKGPQAKEPLGTIHKGYDPWFRHRMSGHGSPGVI